MKFSFFFNIKMIRGSIIPKLNQYYCFGIDNHYKTIMDFGGHREPFDTDIIETAIREAYEESFGIFDFNRDILHQSHKYVTSDTTGFLVDIDSNMDIINNEFANRMLGKEEVENCNIIWIHENEISNYLRKKYLWYPPVRKLMLKIKKVF
jgi:hypothetical protein